MLSQLYLVKLWKPINRLDCIGVQQGDPLGPMIFSLIIQSSIEKLTSELNLWFLDDGVLGGDSETVLNDIVFLSEDFKKLGLEINPSKCEIRFISEYNQEFMDRIKLVNPGVKVIEQDLELLGAPLLLAAVVPLFDRKMKDLDRLLEHLEILDAHTAFYLLRHCPVIPKLMYFIRTSPLWLFPQMICTMDKSLKGTLEKIINITLSPTQWIHASLPIRFGGLGIRKIEDIALPTYLSSTHAVADLVNQMLPNSDVLASSFVFDALNKWKGRDLTLPETPCVQKAWDEINIKSMNPLAIMKSQEEQARFLASTRPEAGYWLHALPSRSLGTLLDNNSFRITIALRLGCDICNIHTCRCGDIVQRNGIHGLSCSKSAGRFSRHQEINSIICRAFQTVKIPAVLEPVGLCRDDGKRVDGSTLIPWAKGQILIWDTTCVDTLAPSYIEQSAKDPGSASSKAALRKRCKYKELIEQNYYFVPFAVETLGSWCSDALKFIGSLGELLNLSSGEIKSKSYLMQRISLAIQRGNAASIMSTFLPSFSMEEIYYIL